MPTFAPLQRSTWPSILHQGAARPCLCIAVCIGVIAYVRQTSYTPLSLFDSTSTSRSVSERPMEPISFSVLTLNVWFGSAAFEQRMRGVADLLVKHSADFVCLQEVTPRAAEIFKTDKRLKQMYDVNKHSVGRYGVLLLAHKQWKATFSEAAFPSNMGRVLLSATMDFNVPGSDSDSDVKKMIISTAHLESLNNHELREKQMEIANKTQMVFENAVLCGDFNFCSYRNFDESKAVLENDSLQKKLPNHVDLWPLLHDTSKEKGFTFDSTTNTNVNKFERMRYDRIVSKLQDFKPSRIEVIGKEPITITAGGSSVHLSDHYGLIAYFEQAH